MTAQHLRLPVAVASELPSERRQVGTHEIGRADRRVDENPSARAADAVVHLVVLVAHHRGVEPADALEERAWKGAEIDRVDFLDLAGVAEAGRSDAEAAVHRLGDAAAERARPLRRHWTADVLGPRAAQPLDAAPHIVGGDDRVRVDAQKDLAMRGAQPEIQCRRYQAPRILEAAEAVVGADGALDDLARAVARSAVDDEDLELPGGVVLRLHGPQAVGDRAGLVAHRNDHRRQRPIVSRGTRRLRHCHDVFAPEPVAPAEPAGPMSSR